MVGKTVYEIFWRAQIFGQGDRVRQVFPEWDDGLNSHPTKCQNDKMPNVNYSFALRYTPAQRNQTWVHWKNGAVAVLDYCISVPSMKEA